MGTKRLALFVQVDGTWYGPNDDVPSDVAKKIENPDVWDDGKSSDKSDKK